MDYIELKAMIDRSKMMNDEYKKRRLDPEENEVSCSTLFYDGFKSVFKKLLCEPEMIQNTAFKRTLN